MCWRENVEGDSEEKKNLGESDMKKKMGANRLLWLFGPDEKWRCAKRKRGVGGDFA